MHCIDAKLFIKFICQEKMAEKMAFTISILFPLSIVLTVLMIRIFKIERTIANYIMIFIAIFGILALIYFIFSV